MLWWLLRQVINFFRIWFSIVYWSGWYSLSLASWDCVPETLVLPQLTVAEWAKGALAGIAKGAPFSLCLTKLHYATVALAAENAIPADSPENDHSQVLVSELWYFFLGFVILHWGGGVWWFSSICVLSLWETVIMTITSSFIFQLRWLLVIRNFVQQNSLFNAILKLLSITLILCNWSYSSCRLCLCYAQVRKAFGVADRRGHENWIQTRFTDVNEVGLRRGCEGSACWQRSSKLEKPFVAVTLLCISLSSLLLYVYHLLLYYCFQECLITYEMHRLVLTMLRIYFLFVSIYKNLWIISWILSLLQKPKWQPAAVEDVALPDVVAVFEKFENTMDELEIPAPAAWLVGSNIPADLWMIILEKLKG